MLPAFLLAQDGAGKSKPVKGPTSVAEALDTLLESAMGMVDAALKHVPNLAVALLVLILTAFVASLAKRLCRRLLRRTRESLRDLFVLFVNIAVWFIGFLLAAGIVFPGFGFAQVVATAGLASIAIGFAFKDIFENFFAGILILWNYPFETGDFIEIEGTGITGKVEDI